MNERYPQHRQPPLATYVIASLILGIILGGGSVFLLVPDRADGGSSAAAAAGEAVRGVLPGDQGEPKTEEAVRAAAQEWADRAAAGDHGGAWDMWVASTKREFSRDDFVRLYELCPSPAKGLRATVDAVTYTPGADTATVRLSQVLAVETMEMRYQDGGWKVVAPEEYVAEYRQYKTGEALAEARRAQGGCGEA